MTRSKRHSARRSGFEPDEPPHLALRAQLMAALKSLMDDRRLTQGRAAVIFGVPQSRVSNLVRGKLDRFTIDALVGFLARADVRVELRILHRPRSTARRTPSPPPAP
jgi:predicted XRE-type DNA-binding protein